MMYIATVISKQSCRRFLEIWQWFGPRQAQQRTARLLGLPGVVELQWRRWKNWRAGVGRGGERGRSDNRRQVLSGKSKRKNKSLGRRRKMRGPLVPLASA